MHELASTASTVRRSFRAIASERGHEWVNNYPNTRNIDNIEAYRRIRAKTYRLPMVLSYILTVQTTRFVCYIRLDSENANYITIL